METTMKTPEELKAAAAALLEQAQAAERAAREQAEQAKRDEYNQKAIALRQAVCDALQMRLMARGVPTTIETYADGWQSGYPYLKGCGVDVEVSVTTVGRYVSTYQITGVVVKVGTYGERPQSWTAATADALPFDKIVASILRRREAKQKEQKARDARHAEHENCMAVREGNKPLAERLNAAYPYYVAPAGSKPGHVVVKFERALTETQTRDLFALLQSFDKEGK